MKESLSEIVMKLIETHSFETLSQQDKLLVLSEMSQEEYNAYHTLTSQVKAIPYDSTVGTPPALEDIKTKLRSNLAPNNSLLRRVSKAQMPVWLAVALSLVGYGLVQLCQGNRIMTEPAIIPQPTIITMVDTVFQKTTDTIFQEIIADPVVITKEIYITKEERPLATKVSSRVSMPAIVPEDQVAYYSDLETRDFIQSQAGKSVRGVESELMEFLNQDEESANNFINSLKDD